MNKIFIVIFIVIIIVIYNTTYKEHLTDLWDSNAANSKITQIINSGLNNALNGLRSVFNVKIPGTKPCPSGMVDSLGSCWKNPYGRGAGRELDWEACPDRSSPNGVGDCIAHKGSRKDGQHSETIDHVRYGDGRGGCSWNRHVEGGLCFTDCEDGFFGRASEGCFANGADSFGVMKRVYNRARFCRGDEDQWGALCYPKCSPGYHPVGCCTCEPDGGSGIKLLPTDRYQCPPPGETDYRKLVGALCYYDPNGPLPPPPEIYQPPPSDLGVRPPPPPLTGEDTSIVNWKQITGSLKQVDFDNNWVCGTNSGGDMYCKDNLEGANWFQVPGNSTHITVSNGKLYSVNSWGNIYYADNPRAGNWKKIEGNLRNIDMNGNWVCGINSTDDIWCKDNLDGSNWFQVPGKLKQLSIDNGKLWGVNSSNNIYYADNLRAGNWRNIGGNLRQVSASGDIICGTNDSNDIWCKKGPDGTWYKKEGALTQVVVSDGRLYGIGGNQDIYYSGTVGVVDPQAPNPPKEDPKPCSVM